VNRELDRIDITIRDIKSKKAIIIENKINNAGDMPRQIPRYYKKLEEQGYSIDAIVYLVLFGSKQPDTRDWTIEERNIILPKFLPIQAYNQHNSDLYNGWLVKCMDIAENSDNIFLLKQYNKLIFKLGVTNMNKPLMEGFLNQMLEGNNYETANALNDMLVSLLNYRRDKIVDHFMYSAFPFTHVFEWKNYAVIENWFSNGHNFAIDVIVTNGLYQVQFFERNFDRKEDVCQDINPVIQLLKDIKHLEGFFPLERRMEKKFTFPKQELDLYAFLESFIQDLNKNNSLETAMI
jgi:hypothetical protein